MHANLTWKLERGFKRPSSCFVKVNGCTREELRKTFQLDDLAIIDGVAIINLLTVAE